MFLNFKGAKLSNSRGTAVEVPYFLSKYDPDPLRVHLTAVAPETHDTEFAWEDFVGAFPSSAGRLESAALSPATLVAQRGRDRHRR